MRAPVAAVPFLLAVLLAPAVAGAGRPADDAAGASPAAAPAEDGATVPARAGPGETAPEAVPAVGTTRENPASIAGPTEPLPALPVPGLTPVPDLSSTANRHALALVPEFVVPLGDWADITGLGLGLGLTYAYRATDQLALTGRTGYIVHLENERRLAGGTADLHTHEVPLLAGVRYAPLPGLYGAVEAGLIHFRAEREYTDHIATDGGFRLGGTIGAGYRLERFDFGARFFLPDLVGRDEGASLSTGFAMEVGYEVAGF
jgi:hypothetical protein